jgi:hypothetical protein
MDFCIDASQLRAALANIEAAEKNGFHHCLAVFRMSTVGLSVADCRATYSDLVERAHPTDSRLDWGRFQRVSVRYRFEGGELIPAPPSSIADTETKGENQ